MDCGLFGVRFLFLGYKNGAAAPVDYSSTFATAPSVNPVSRYFVVLLALLLSCCLQNVLHTIFLFPSPRFY